MAVGSLMFWTRSLRNINLRIKRSGFCVQHAHVKNQMIQVHCFSPHQFVFGRGVHIPEDFMSEPSSIITATASLREETLAKSQAKMIDRCV
jgi:hypothetical protein